MLNKFVDFILSYPRTLFPFIVVYSALSIIMLITGIIKLFITGGQ